MAADAREHAILPSTQWFCLSPPRQEGGMFQAHPAPNTWNWCPASQLPAALHTMPATICLLRLLIPGHGGLLCITDAAPAYQSQRC